MEREDGGKYKRRNGLKSEKERTLIEFVEGIIFLN